LPQDLRDELNAKYGSDVVLDAYNYLFINVPSNQDGNHSIFSDHELVKNLTSYSSALQIGYYIVSEA